MPRLTTTLAENASYPRHKGSNGYHVVWDNLVPGFGLRCNPGDSKTYVCAYRHRGRKRLLMLGRRGAVAV